MTFQHLTPWITDDDIGQLRVTPDVSKHWNRLTNGDSSTQAERRVEEIFEDVRQQYYPLAPSRKNCIFLFDFGLDGDRYAAPMFPIEFRDERHLVEVVCDPAKAIIARVDKSFVDKSAVIARSANDDSPASRDAVVLNAHRYWLGTTRSDYDTEILLCGEFMYARIIRKAEDPLDVRQQRFQKERILAGRNRLADLIPEQ